MKKFLITSFAAIAACAVIMGGFDKTPAVIVNAATASGNNSSGSASSNNPGNGGNSGGQSSASSNNPTPGSGSQTQNSYSIKAYASNNGGKAIGSATYEKGKTVTLKAIVQDGYAFGGWFENNICVSGNPTYLFTADRDRTLIANITVNNTRARVENVFTDVTGNKWYTSAVQFAYNNDMMAGYGNGLFKPEQAITRAEFCAVMYNADGKPDVQWENRFRDVQSKDKWYVKPVMWMVQNGFAAGYGDEVGYTQRRFGVGDYCSREHVVQMLHSYAAMKGYSLSTNINASAKYTDKADIAGWANNSVNWAVYQGILDGTGLDQEQFKPRQAITRAECAAIMRNFLEKVAK